MTKFSKYVLSALILIVSIAGFWYFQPVSYGANQIIPFDSNRWEITAKESKLEDYLGKKSIFFRDGIAFVKDSQFTDGIIEYDVAFSQDRAFLAGVWRLQDVQNYEKFYMRPHQSGNPDATQYTPVFNNVTGWQLYSGEGYTAPFKFTFNEWMHVKIVVAGNKAEAYINDMDKPVLVVSELKAEEKPGKVGVLVEEFGPAHFANFSYTSMSNPPLKGQPKPIKETPAGTIMSWLVSNNFDEKLLDGKVNLTGAEKQGLSWEKLNTERSGLANVARVHGIDGNKNTVFARTTIISDREQIKPLEFGFSDRIKLYLNDQSIYNGKDDFGSRDYRFMGTIGYYDEIYLPLKKGKNELWLAVSEGPFVQGRTVGGWGVEARFKDLEGISIAEPSN